MNTVFKAGAAGAMTLAAIAAHASIASPTSASPDAILFAEVLNSAGTAAVASYAGDTGISVASLTKGAPSKTVLGGDANLQALFAADAAGDSVVYAVLGGQYTGAQNTANFQTPGVANFITTTNANSTQSLTNATTGKLVNFSQLSPVISAINSNINGAATSIEGANPATSGQFDVTAGLSNVAYWNGGSISNANPVGGSQNLYYVTAGSPAGTFTHLAYTLEGTASLSSSGLTLTAAGGGGGTPPPVPLPAAFWLLGSGLLGLTGVARRKLKA